MIEIKTNNFMIKFKNETNFYFHIKFQSKKYLILI